ncbi:MAG TPA: L,D-transpeptidase family protein [Sporichthyaceae bacterium]|jgi:L,D-peptidoglycan transpeptidase YkuD (ErfK/YbiS/YcfS/YnhG family)|nr:L,D-transpeptidase family protein [Sporichthyaceae bacterium]
MGNHVAWCRRPARRAARFAAAATGIAALGLVLVLGTMGAAADGRTSATVHTGLPIPPIPPILPGLAPAPAPSPAKSAAPQPAWAPGLPADTTQVIRTTYSHQWCTQLYCTKTEAWEKVGGVWRLAAGPGLGGKAVFRSTVGPRGFAPPGKRRTDDGRTPSGEYSIFLTFSTTGTAPGPMPWRRRWSTSVISSNPGPTYNTWMENGSGGDRPSMQYGFWVDYNHPRLTAGAQPAPDPALGSGIFYHTSWPNTRWLPTYGCTNVSLPDQMRWLVAWLRPSADPRVLNNIS